MKIAILHLSDIHIRSEKDPVFGHIEKIAAAATSLSTEVSHYLLVITGDVANWGLQDEYLSARVFLDQLLNELKTNSFLDVNLQVVIVPGNHDCDFKTDKQKVEVRDAIIPTLGANLKDLEISGGIIQQCLSVQENFFNFLNGLPDVGTVSQNERLCYTREVDLNGKKLVFRCLNTAWVSQISEVQGQLLFPVELTEKVLRLNGNGGDLVLSLQHHPFNWLEHSNSRRLSSLLEETSDVILTGHEHIADVFTKSKHSGERVQYIAGSVLQEHGESTSGFNVILIDFDAKQQQLVEFVLDGSHYRSRTKGAWAPFVRNRFLAQHGFFNSPEFEGFLDQLGTEFTHPYRKKGTLTLSDLFVTPDLTEFPFDATTTKNKIVKSDDTLKTVYDASYGILYGADNSGKTSLAKTIYRDWREREIVPVLLKPAYRLDGHDEVSLRTCLDQAISEQYSSSVVESFYQLDRDKRGLIIDDLQRFQMNAEGRRQFLKTVQGLFGNVVVFASDIYQYQPLLEPRSGSKTALDYTEFKIRELGRKLRGRLIRRWLQVGRELIIDAKDISHEENVLEKALNDSISKNVIPSYPFWIISILQLWNSETATNQNLGAFGYIFESLIGKQLEDIGYDATKIDKIYTFLGGLAFFLFEREELTLTYEELREVNKEYFQRHRVQIKFDELLLKLQDARVLKHSDGIYSFTQPYIFYFFVARYIRETLAAGKDQEKLRAVVTEMIQHISYEPYSYVLLILVYLTKNHRFIEQIIDHAKGIFADLEPCDLTSSVDFLNRLSPGIEPIEIPDNNVERNREEYRDSIDESEAEDLADALTLADNSDEIVTYSDDLDDLNKMIIAMKTLELMGQILRNFPGSLFAETKFALTKECYLLGLRTLQAFMKIASEDIIGFREYYTKIVKERRAHVKQADLNRAAEAMLLWLTAGATFGIIKRVSGAVGHEDLVETYAEVKRDLPASVSVELIDLSVRLDHFRGIPYAQINDGANTLRKNAFAYNILRDLVSHFLYLFPVAQDDLQRLTAKFDIGTPHSRLLLNDAKRSTKRKRRSKKK